MFSRISILPRVSVLIRQLNCSTKNSKQITVTTNNESLKSKKIESNDQETDKYRNNENNKKNQNLVKGIKKAISLNKNLYPNVPVTNIKVSEACEDAYKLILAKLTNNEITNKEYIKTCQELNDLCNLDSSVSEIFKNESIKSKVTSKLKELIISNKLNNDSIVTIAIYLGRMDQKEFNTVNKRLVSMIPHLRIEQLLSVITILRVVNKNKLDKEQDNTILALIRDKVDQLKTYDSIKITMKLFQNDQLLLKNLEEKILKISETLTTDNWIDLLNTSSIIKRKNINIIETCAYNINRQKISLASAQKCLLSCGVLNYRDDQFMKFLVNRVNELLDENKSDSKWVLENKVNLFSIISSIGMLNIRDKNCLNNFCEVLVNNCQDSRLLINLIITCGSLNFKPHLSEKVVEKIKLTDFSFQNMERREKMFLLNYVWSLCMLNQSKDEFIDVVLKRDFWEEMIGNDENELYKKQILMKLMNINLYAQLLVDNYNGVLLPEEINASKYSNTLKLQFNHSINSFFSTLSSFRSEDYFKTNMLTPFGIVIDALMVIDKNGNPCKIADYFNEMGQLETKDRSEKKIAFKVVDSKDIISIGNKISGNLTMQVLLLKELGYTPIMVTQQELFNSSLIERVNSLQKKLEKAAHKD